ncbi:MAG: hypothetical protein EZS28_053743, partial [Streblomastix strix]
MDLKSSNKSPECLDEFCDQEIPQVLKKFLGPKEQDEKFVLSTTILHIVGVYDKISDDIIRSNAAIEPLIQIIHSPNENRSKAASKTLGELAEDDDSIRMSLLTTGFLGTVQHTLSFDQQKQTESKSSSSSQEISTPDHVKSAILDVLLMILHSS